MQKGNNYVIWLMNVTSKGANLSLRYNSISQCTLVQNQYVDSMIATGVEFKSPMDVQWLPAPSEKHGQSHLDVVQQ